MKRALSIVCLLLILSTLMVGCAKDAESVDGAADDSVTTAEDNSELYDANGYLKDSIPDEIDYGGELIRIMGWGSTEASYDFNTEGENNQIASATFMRNEMVKTRMGVNLEFILDYQGDNADRYNYVPTVETNLMAGENYDLIACYSMNAANFATDGYLIDLNTQKGVLNMDKPWWSSNMLEGSIINNKLYFASGSISTTSILQTHVLAINLELARNKGLDDPRELVEEGKWTMEELFTMCNKTYDDINTDIDGKDNGDAFGLAMFDSSAGDAFLASNGLQYLSTDNTGKIVIAPSFKSEKIYDLAKTLIDKFKTNDYIYEGGNVKNGKVFTGKRAIFSSGYFFTLLNMKQDITFEYGYLPYPKADASQDEYYCSSGFPYSMWCIPQQSTDYERSAYIMECMASEGYRRVQPKVYDEIKYKVGSDLLNSKMFDIIIESKTYDLGRIYHNMFKWEESPVALFRTRMYKDDALDWYSALSGKSAAMEGVITIINSGFGY